MLLLVQVDLLQGNIMEFGIPWIQARVNMYLEEKAMKQANAEAGELDKEIEPMTQVEA